MPKKIINKKQQEEKQTDKPKQLKGSGPLAIAITLQNTLESHKRRCF
ncbi:MAG: hypothetical protein U9Q85_01985 [Patescibacteria group bacterium]|nr:hypothetical protein [Patescibacteria group bacterium]